MLDYIHQELHERTALPVTAPCRIRHSAYLLPTDDSGARGRVRDKFTEIMGQMGIASTAVNWGERAGNCEKEFGDGSLLRVLWELHTEFYSYTTVLVPPDKGGSRNIPSEPYMLPAFPTFGDKLIDLDLLVVGGKSLSKEHRAFLFGSTIYGGRVVNREGAIWTTFQVNEWGQERYVIAAGSLKPGRLGRLVRRVMEIENYYHLVLMPLREYRQQVVLLRESEKKVTKHSETIAAGLSDRSHPPEEEHLWLSSLTKDLADLIRLTETMRYRLSAANSYYAIFEERMLWLREEIDPGYQSYREFLTSRVAPAIRGYRNFIERADALTNQVTVLSNMMRTRVNMNMEQQGLKNMEAMNRRVELQLMLQRTVEGLSLIVISYYLTGLSNYLFKALEPLLPLPGNPTIWSAMTIPVWLGLSFVFTRRVKAKVAAIEKRKEAPEGRR